jgi:ppGpp synthetase/RelA/SpoT-type nucleotidyltranferase
MLKNNNERILSDYNQKSPIYNDYIKVLEDLIHTIIQDHGNRVNSITSRVKNEQSFKEKLSRKNNKYESLEDITDIVGIRIITYYADDVDTIAKIIEEEFDIDYENSIDKRKVLDPDRFGYLSLHYVIKLNKNRLLLTEYRKYAKCKAEVQIRSILQHAWAEIEHDSGYKSSLDVPIEIKIVKRSTSLIRG